MPHTLHVVSHTHWDREWYLTFQQFRMRLVDLIDHLLDLLDRDAEFRSFHLDAQTIVLEDYLAIRPQQRARLEGYIRAGRVIVGPWYQLNDAFLTSGEATIRSLLIGSRMARAFGACASIGYLPDQFGNLSQMPQIFRGFGIDNAIMGRGYQLRDGRKMEFIWEGPDGSRVTASLMAFWYNNAQHFPAEAGEALRYTEALRERMGPHAAVSHLLLMNGVDHLEPQQDLSPILAGVQARLPEGERIVHSTVEAYIDAVKEEAAGRGLALEIHRGELREDRGGACLAGTLSTRMYIKQANHRAQVILERAAEPFSVFAMQAGGGYPYDFLHYAWKLLMNNHPHDSICGCSIDQVHREMMPRFAQVEQIGEEMVERALRLMAARVALPEGGAGLVVFNALNWTRTDPVQAQVIFPLGDPARGSPLRDDSRQVRGFKILDDSGEEVPFVVESAAVKMRAVLSPVELPLDQWVQEFVVTFIAREMPPCGYRCYSLVSAETMPVYPAWEEPYGGQWQPVLEDVGDVGDEYLYRRPEQDERLEHRLLPGAGWEERSAIRQSGVYEFDWELPAAAQGVEGRARERVACRVRTRVTRWRGAPRVEFETTIDNRARDHRVRVVFKNGAGFQAEPYSIAEGQFDVLRRPLAHPDESEGASPFYPQQNWAALTGQENGAARTVTVINQGLPEYEVYAGEGSPALAVTLLRAVNYLSRRGDGPQIETPEAQCLGEHTFRYAVVEKAGGWQEGKAWQQGHQFNVPLRAVQTHSAAGEVRDLPGVLSFIRVEPDGLVVTAIKRAEDEPGRLVVRFFNITEEVIAGGRVVVRGATACRECNLDEEARADVPVLEGGEVMLRAVNPKEIVTLMF